MRAKPQLRGAIQLVERLQSAKPERGEVGIVDKAFIQIALQCVVKTFIAARRLSLF